MNYHIKTTYGKGNIQMLQVCKDIEALEIPVEERLVFDLTTYGETTPFSNLILINTLRKYKKMHREHDIMCLPKDHNGYLSHIGFYKACGISIGKEPGEARSSSNYVPITDLSVYGYDFYREIEKKAFDLSSPLMFDEELQRMLTYSFIENIRNSYEHANVKNVLVAAQKWPSRNIVEIAIADAGVGITGSLSKFFSTNQVNLLKLACEPGISAKSNYSYLNHDDQWRNSGYGLYILKELALAYGGSFILCSGTKALRYSFINKKKKIEVFETDYEGTAIGIRLRTDMGSDFRTIIDSIVLEGQKRAEKIEGAIRNASKSSGGRYLLGQ